jgi:uncharacterized delta-60 repeat protein
MRNWLVALLVIGLMGMVLVISRCGRVVEEETVTTTTSTPTTTLFPAPSNLSAEAYTLQNTLRWDAVSGAASYNLYWSTSSGVTKSNGTKIAGVTSPYTHKAAGSPLTNGQTYYYVVTAVDSSTNESADSSQAAATPHTLGILDDSFGSDGIAASNSAAGGNGDDWGRSIAVDSEGKILAAGASWNGSDDDMVVWRYSTDGTLDTNFGIAGIVKSDNAAGGNGTDEGQAIALDSSGNILVAGRSYNGSNYDMVIWKYGSNGGLDTSFGTGGIVVCDNTAGGSGDEIGYDIALDSSGNVLVAGASSNGSDNDMVVWKFNSSGATVSAFGTGGAVICHGSAGGAGLDIAYSITLDSSDNVLVTGRSSNGSDDDMVVWKFTSGGATVSAFGRGGVAVAGGSSHDRGNAIILDSSGNILVAGIENNGSDDDLAVWKFDSDGNTVEAFGAGGVAVRGNIAGGNAADSGWGITTDYAGRILTSGYSSNGSNNDMVVLRLNSDGSTDEVFGTNGAEILHNTAGGNGEDEGYSVTTDVYGRILVTGKSENASGNTDMVIWRFK